MSKAVLEILNPSLQKTEIWLNDFMANWDGTKIRKKRGWRCAQRCMRSATG